jgi:hypothetical protein
VKTLPNFLDLKPVKVDYRVPGGADGWKKREEVKPKREPPRVSLGSEWHTFFDPRGKEYFHNFSTGEFGRRPTRGDREERRPSDTAEAYLKSVAEARGGRKLKLFSVLDREGVYKHKRKPQVVTIKDSGANAAYGLTDKLAENRLKESDSR